MIAAVGGVTAVTDGKGEESVVSVSVDRDLIARTGPDTPTGRLLRSFWHPIATVAQLGVASVRAVRLLGEELVLYRTTGDSAADYGLLGRHCPHRLADLSYGWSESGGIRCMYHGWLFDNEGRCREQPYEDAVNPDSLFRDRVRALAYPTASHGGLIWAHLDPSRPARAPRPEFLDEGGDSPEITIRELDVSWLCRMAESFPADLVGYELAESPSGGSTLRPVRGEGAVALWPTTIRRPDSVEWVVPVDDHRSVSITMCLPDNVIGRVADDGAATISVHGSYREALQSELESMRGAEPPDARPESC